MRPRNPLLQKQALDETFVMWNDSDYAEHQHHSDPNFTTQNGKDYAGRGSTETEQGALQDGIPANLLSVELGKTGDVDNPNVTTIPSAPAAVDPDDAEFFKESDDLSPAEEKITDAVRSEGFHYGARVTDGSTLWFRGSNERLSFNPKTGNVTYLKNGKVQLECPVNDLKKHVNQMLKSAAREFHETLKAMLGQTAAIRPSPHKVFDDKIDDSTGIKPPAPDNPSDDDIQKAQQTLDNAGVGDQIGKNASKYGDKLKKMQLRRDPDGIEAAACHHKKTTCRKCSNVQTCRCSAPKISSFVDTCSNCDGTFDKDGAVTKSYGSGTPSGGTPNDPSIDADDEEAEKTASKKTALVGIHETPRHLPPRDDMRRHVDEDVKDEVMEGVMDGVKDAKVADGEDYDYELDEANEHYLDEIGAMKNEAKEAFLQDPFMLQDASDNGLTMDELWDQVGQDFIQNYWESVHAKTGAIPTDEGIPCPNCKSTKGKPVEDGEESLVSLRECLTCGSFF